MTPDTTTEVRAGAPAPARKARAARWTRGLSGIAVFLLLAQAFGWSGIVSQSALPLMSTVLAKAAGLVVNTQFLTDFGATVEAWALGLLITVLVGVPCGLVLGSLPGVRVATRAIVEFLRPIPSVSIIPLVTLVLGAGLRMTLTLIVYAAIWPVLFNTIYGLDDVDPLAKETLRAFGFSPLGVVRHVSLPSAAPFIATGIRLASSIAIILGIGTGYLTGRINGNGIGSYIVDQYNGAASDAIALVLAATFWTGILGLTLNSLLVWAERRLFRWHHAYTGELT